MKLRHWLLAIFLAGAALTFLRHALSADTSAGTARPDSRGTNGFAYLGAGSCSASACHNNPTTHGISGHEFAIWATRDPHSKAYEALFNDRSRTIQQALNRKVPPHEDRRCLKCHVTPDDDLPRPAHFRTDGVSCETCHGPAKQWIDVHHLEEWKQRSVAAKQRFGMRDLHSVVGRARTCVPCHVGAPGMEVDHDLIAAGHPRLRFEFAAFHAHMPRHWPDEVDRIARPDFAARVWVIGQIAAAHAELEQLARRAAPTQPIWPEFAEHDCAACHHALSDRVFEDFAKRKPGNLQWGGRVTTLDTAIKSLEPMGDAKLSEALAKLRAAFDAGKPDRALIYANAKAAAACLEPWLNHFEQRKLHAKWFEKMSDDLENDPKPRLDVDGETNHLLAIMALRQARSDVGLPSVADDRLDNLLRLTQRLKRAIPYEPAAVQQRLRHIPR